MAKTLKQLQALHKKLESEIDDVKQQIDVLSRKESLKDITARLGELAKKWETTLADVALDIAILSIPKTHQKILKDIKKEIAKKPSAPVVQKKVIRHLTGKTKAELLKDKNFVKQAKDMKIGQSTLALRWGVSVSTIRRCRIDLKVL